MILVSASPIDTDEMATYTLMEVDGPSCAHMLPLIELSRGVIKFDLEVKLDVASYMMPNTEIRT
jgi:hypothetical protein